MVTVIKTSGSLRNTLNYNEHKLKQKAAVLIHSANYGKDTDELGFTDKIRTLEKLSVLNQRAKLNSVHISLNFDPSEKPDKETLQRISETYMERIGFGGQPYLVYQHHDTGHPHIHIVTTNIQPDGSRIKMQNIGRNQSEQARKEIETEFKLVPAQRLQFKQVLQIKPFGARKVEYGKSETKRAITNVLDAVLPIYRFTSLAELNAVLRLYNVVADGGSEDSRIYKNNGLIYRVLDDKGQKIGKPVKASAIYNNPGLKFLQEKFTQNEPLRQPYKSRIKNAIDGQFSEGKRPTLRELETHLHKERISLVLRKNGKGVIYGVTYVDHQTRCVFNGSDLGKQYSSKALLERCRPWKPVKQDPENHLTTFKVNNLVKDLLQPEFESSPVWEFRQNEMRKRRRKKIHR